MLAHPFLTPDKADIALVKDRYGRAEWRVEYPDDDGFSCVTIFAGPNAERRAQNYHVALKSGTLEPIHPDR